RPRSGSCPAFVAESADSGNTASKTLSGPLARLCAAESKHGGTSMYAVIRAGGKQYRVAPGDVIRVESVGGEANRSAEFNDVLAVSAGDGQIGKPSEARVTGEVVEQGRGAKILVFHYKRKKQYKKLRGHRQNYSAVRITEIAYDGQSFTAPELPKKEPKPKKARPQADAEAGEKLEAKAAKPAAKAKKKSAPKKSAAKKGSSKKK